MFIRRSELESLRQELDDLLGVQGGRGDWVDGVVRKRITVHTRDNHSIEGSLTETMDDGLVLRAAQLLNDEGPATTMAGEVFIPRENVAFAQLDE